MRVLLAAESFLPYLSGVTVSVDSLARGLGARGHEVMVLAPRPAAGSATLSAGSHGPEPRYAWLPSYQLPMLVPHGYRMPWPLPRTTALDRARGFAPDVVHAHSPFVIGLLARSLARAIGAPLVFTHHTRFGDYAHYLGPLAPLAARATDAYLRRFWRSCAAIVAPSADLADEIRARLRAPDRARVHAIPTGVDVHAIDGLVPVDVRDVAGWGSETVVVASLGRLAPEKSPMLQLEAAASALARHPGVRLLVVGGGPSERLLRRRAEAPDLAGHVHFTGALPRMEALSWVRGADLFLFTSRTETQGLVLAEALAAGLPAVALRGPGVADSVRDDTDGIVVADRPEADRAARLGEAIAGLAANERRRRAMAERARGDAQRFAVEGRIDEVEELYGSVRG